MASLIYSMLMSLDGYIEGEDGNFAWAKPGEEVFRYITELSASIGTYLYGRKMYETMVFWETAQTLPDLPESMVAWTRQWQAAEKIVYSKTLSEPQSARTRLEGEFDPDVIRRLKADAERDIAVAGPEIAGQVVKAGLVDEFQLIVCPVIVGGGKQFFPSGVGMKLELVEDRRFGDGTVVLRYAGRG
jgi:dihydrofolate reductase